MNSGLPAFKVNLMDEKLSQSLQGIGFTEKEALVYLALMELGSGTVTDIAQRAKLKRSIIYIILEGLIKRGYVSEIPGTKINRYVAAEPTKIFNDLKNQVSDFKNLLPSFLAIYNKTTWKPKINYFEGKEGIISVFRQTEQAKEAYYISNMASMTKQIPEEVERWVDFFQNKTPKNYICKQILTNTPADIKFAKLSQNKNVKFKFLPKDKTLDMDISLFNNKVALTSLEDKLFIVVIESTALYNSMKTIFDLLWQQEITLKNLKSVSEKSNKK
jgi:sugar-specific transcriptional regulator TrmB